MYKKKKKKKTMVGSRPTGMWMNNKLRDMWTDIHHMVEALNFQYAKPPANVSPS